MHPDNARQAEGLLLALLIGLAAGLLYDLLRPLRWRARGLPSALADLLFCLTLGAALFLYAMSLGDGRLGLGAIAVAGLGFALYEKLLSPRVLPLFGRIFHYMDTVPVLLKKTLKKIRFFSK